MSDATDPKNEEREYFVDKYGTGLRTQTKASLLPILLKKLKVWGYRENISPEIGGKINRFEAPTEPRGNRNER